MIENYKARHLGLVFSTTECGAAVRDDAGNEAYAAVPMQGQTNLRGWPSHHLEHIPEMLDAVLGDLRAAGWDFSQPGHLSQAWRQHDLALIGEDNAPLIPALSWQCNAATGETKELTAKAPDLVRSVGRIEPRFVVAKLPWILAEIPELQANVRHVMLSGDWVNRMLTQHWRLGASDALCNGLLNQQTKAFAAAELEQANAIFGGRLQPDWFPPVIETSGIVGEVRDAAEPRWRGVTRLLTGWKAVAFLGDNQAAAAGCGAADYRTIVISLGTSGTINRICPPSAPLPDEVLSFDYWNDRLHLMMLAECGSWYELFKKSYEPNRDHAQLDEMAAGADLSQVRYVPPPGNAAAEPATWRSPELASLGAKERVASVQVSIALELLKRAKHLSAAANGATPIDTFILTGGLVRARLLRDVLHTGLHRLARRAEILVNDRPGALAHKSDALGAICNAMIAAGGAGVAAVIGAHSRLTPCAGPRQRSRGSLDALIRHVA